MAENISKKEIKLKINAKEKLKRFNRELKKEINTAIIAAFGFLIALVWKDVITEWVNNISSKSPFQGKLLSALFVTIICVFGIMILTKVLSDKEERKSKN